MKHLILFCTPRSGSNFLMREITSRGYKDLGPYFNINIPLAEDGSLARSMPYNNIERLGNIEAALARRIQDYETHRNRFDKTLVKMYATDTKFWKDLLCNVCGTGASLIVLQRLNLRSQIFSWLLAYAHQAFVKGKGKSYTEFTAQQTDLNRLFDELDTFHRVKAQLNPAWVAHDLAYEAITDYLLDSLFGDRLIDSEDTHQHSLEYTNLLKNPSDLESWIQEWKQLNPSSPLSTLL